jgi:hypothetical protein
MMIYPIVFIAYLTIMYSIVGHTLILNKFRMYLNRDYWINYNIIEFASWMAKAIIIIPGLIFGIELWYMHFITLITSSLLIWASMKKSLPTLILFNSIWICISLTIILKHLAKWL